MEEILKFIANNFPGLWSAISCVLTVLEALVLSILLIRNRHGKDIDKDGVPDVPAKFNDWFIEVDGKRIYFRDMVFLEDKK